MRNRTKNLLILLAVLIAPYTAHADTNPLLDFKGRLKWVGESSLASYKAILSDNFTDASTTTTEQPATTTTLTEPTTTLAAPTTTVLSPTTTLDSGGCEDDEDHDGYRDHDCDDHGRAVALTFSVETSNGGLPGFGLPALFDFRCDLTAKGKGKYACKLPGVKVKIRPYKTAGTHRVNVRYTNDIPRPLGGQIKVILLSEVFGRVYLDTTWPDAPNGYKVRGH